MNLDLSSPNSSTKPSTILRAPPNLSTRSPSAPHYLPADGESDLTFFFHRGGLKRANTEYTSSPGLFNWLKLGDSLKQGTAQKSETWRTRQPWWTGTQGPDTDLEGLAAVQRGLWLGRCLWRYSRIKSWSARSQRTPAERPRPLAGEATPASTSDQSLKELAVDFLWRRVFCRVLLGRRPPIQAWGEFLLWRYKEPATSPRLWDHLFHSSPVCKVKRSANKKRLILHSASRLHFKIWRYRI